MLVYGGMSAFVRLVRVCSCVCRSLVVDWCKDSLLSFDSRCGTTTTFFQWRGTGRRGVFTLAMSHASWPATTNSSSFLVGLMERIWGTPLRSARFQTSRRCSAVRGVSCWTGRRGKQRRRTSVCLGLEKVLLRAPCVKGVAGQRTGAPTTQQCAQTTWCGS